VPYDRFCCVGRKIRAEKETAGPSTSLRFGRDDNFVLPLTAASANLHNKIVIPTEA
jgi:hypothetical protein